jgi:hypothetical protein
VILLCLTGKPPLISPNRALFWSLTGKPPLIFLVSEILDMSSTSYDFKKTSEPYLDAWWSPLFFPGLALLPMIPYTKRFKKMGVLHASLDYHKAMC